MDELVSRVEVIRAAASCRHCRSATSQPSHGREDEAAAEMTFHRGVPGLSLRDRKRF